MSNLNPCNDKSPNPDLPNQDPFLNNCEIPLQFQSCEGVENLFHQNIVNQGADFDENNKKDNLGQPNYCDPMTTGQIVEDNLSQKLPPDKSVIYRYAQTLRATDQATKKLFENVIVQDVNGKTFKVPCIWGTQEKAVQVLTGNNIRKDNTGVVDRIILPAMSIYTSSYEFDANRYLFHRAVDYKRTGTQARDAKDNPIGHPHGPPGVSYQERTPRDTVLGFTRGIPLNLGYTLTIWTRYWEDMNQILTQVCSKFNMGMAYIKIQGIDNWETTVKIGNISNNLDMEPGDRNTRIFKFQIALTTETFVLQPIVRRKSVLKTKIDIVDGISDDEINCILTKIESEVGPI